jgi:hypothetical protein
VSLAEAPTLTEFPELEEIFGEHAPEDCAHIVRRLNAETGAGELILYAMINGIEVEALCGYRWVPVELNPPEKPICQRCVALHGKA